MRHHLFPFLVLLSSFGCKERSKAALFDDDSAAQGFICSEGEGASFAFAALEYQPDPAVVYDGLDASRLVSPSADYQIQIDVCYTETNNGFDFKPHRIIFHDKQGQTIFRNASTFTGFAEGVTEGKWEKLHIEAAITVFAPDGESTNGIDIRGWSGAGGSFVTGTRTVPHGITSLKLITGTLVNGAVMGNLACKPGETQKNLTYSFGTAEISTIVCSFDDGDQTTGFRYARVKVRDKEPQLTEEQRQPQIIENDGIAAQVKAQFSHHNMYDWAVFTFPHATYKWERIEYNLACSIKYGQGPAKAITCPDEPEILPYAF
ncbi:MAG: hypothetical protein AB7T49_19405 [Oligoflexales bacterium]